MHEERMPRRAWIVFLGATASVATLLGVVGFFVVPSGKQMPIHADLAGFDNFASRTTGLTMMIFLPLLVAAAFLGAYFMTRGFGRFVIVVIGIFSMLVALIFNIQALRYGLA